jgi:sodium pump decarboxylase gamma subunit
MQVLENFKHAETFVQMSMNDKIIATGYVIVLGMGITFIALILIWWITVLMSKTIQKFEAKTHITEVKPKEQIAASYVAAPVQNEDEALIAVITAAIAASMNTTMQGIRVTNIRRISDSTPTWGKSGRSDVMNARF